MEDYAEHDIDLYMTDAEIADLFESLLIEAL